MANNTGFVLLVGLGALFVLGRAGKPMFREETVDDIASTTIVGDILQSDNTAAILVSPDAVQIGSGEVVTATELAVRRSEQIKKQVFDWSAGALPSASNGAAPMSQGDIDTIALESSEFVYGGAPRPTSSAKPRWSNKYGWWWMNPQTGNAVGPDGVEWSPGDTSVNMGSPGTNIGRTLPPGWVKNPGGSADWVGLPEHDFELA